MPTYTICSKVLAVAAMDDEYLLGILYRLLTETQFKICLDNENKILQLYKQTTINLKSKDLSDWFSYLTKDSKRIKKNLTIIEYKFKGTENEREIFIIICKLSSDKKLICEKKEDYPEVSQIIFIDKDETLNELKNANYTINAHEGSNVAVDKGKIKIYKKEG